MEKRYIVYQQDNAVFIEDLQNEDGHLLPALFTHVEGAQKLADQLNAQADEIERLRETLEPFAKFAETIEPSGGANDSAIVARWQLIGNKWALIRIGDIRKAARALGKK